jgi:prepilin-type N-terminal cleavage/methylation domain-containing protein
MRKIFKKEKGFTLLEIMTVLVVMGILAAIAVSRATNFTTEVYAGVDTLKTSLRYAQTAAMNYNSTSSVVPVIWGINYDSGANQYWLFWGTNPNNNISLLPEGTQYATVARKIDLNAKKIKFTANFTIYFDNRGIPYTAYTDATTNTPLANNLVINVQPLNAITPNIAVTITPLTGYIQ